MKKSEVIRKVIFSLSENIKYKFFFHYTSENISFSNIHIILLMFSYIS